MFFDHVMKEPNKKNSVESDKYDIKKNLVLFVFGFFFLGSGFFADPD